MEVKKSEIVSYMLLGLILSPIIYIFFNIFKENSEYSNQIFEYLVSEYIYNTFIVVIFVTLLATSIGIFLAYFETFYEYRFRIFFKYVNILAFSIPSYLLAYIYSDMFTGPIYYYFNINFDIANIKGMIVLLSFSFYPYVYLIARSYMKKISPNIIYVAKTLGKSNFEIFLTIILPISKVAIISAMMLVIMESVNSFGIANYFGIEVFSTGIYKAWINAYDLDAAIKLSAIIMICIFMIIFIERIYRNRFKYEFQYTNQPLKREKLSKIKEIIIVSAMFLIFSFSFLIPLIYIFRLFYYSLEYIEILDISRYTLNSIKITFLSSISIILVSLFILTVFRLKKNKYRWLISSISSLGYSIPGVVIAIGIISIVITLDKYFIKLNISLLNSIFVILIAYMSRFMSLAYNNIDAGMKKIGNNYHLSSRILGKNSFYTFLKIDLFMLKNVIASSFLLVSIEILKELPLANLILSDNTLAIQISNYAKDEDMVLAAPLSLIMILITFLLLVIYNFIEKRGEKDEVF